MGTLTCVAIGLLTQLTQRPHDLTIQRTIVLLGTSAQHLDKFRRDATGTAGSWLLLTHAPSMQLKRLHDNRVGRLAEARTRLTTAGKTAWRAAG